MVISKFSQEIIKSAKILKKGGVILYPTDTVWGIGCDSTDLEAVQKIHAVKRRDPKKPLILLVNSPQMLRCTVKVPQQAWQLINETTHPLTIIYEHPMEPFSILSANDGTLGVRLTRNLFCQELIKAIRAPLISTSANPSGSPTPLSYDQIDLNILEKVDYSVDLCRKHQATYPGSSIVRWNKDGSWKVLRK